MKNIEIDTHFMINDGLKEMAANAVEIVVDDKTGIVYAVYLSSETAIGESNQFVKLAKFNIMQPTNVAWTTVFDRDSDFDGKLLSECNVIELDSDTVRVYTENMATGVYYYKDVDKKTLNVGAKNEVKLKIDEDADSVVLKLQNVNVLLTSLGASPIGTFNMTTKITKVDGFYYSILCGNNIESPLFIKSTDGEEWTFVSAIPHKANYEAMLCYHDSKFWVFCRDGFETGATEPKQNLMYSEDGINWKQSNLTLNVSDTRPYLFNFQGELYLAYSSPLSDKYSTVRTWRCNIHIGRIVSINGEETFEEIIYKESKFGIVYYALIDWYGHMIMLYSSGELHPMEGLLFGWAQGKDCLNYAVLHTQEPRLYIDTSLDK